jgi:hypothetical protein
VSCAFCHSIAVAVARVEVGAELLEIEVDVAGRVCAIDQR